VERFEVAEPGIGFEPIQSLRDAVEGSLAEAFGLGQIGEVRALDPLILGLCIFMGVHYAEHHCFAYRSIHSRRLKTLGTST
jgi:hypothetical protein